MNITVHGVLRTTQSYREGDGYRYIELTVYGLTGKNTVVMFLEESVPPIIEIDEEAKTDTTGIQVYSDGGPGES